MIEGVKVAKNTVIQILGKIISILLGVAALGIMTRYLGQEGYGQYITILVFLQFFGILMDLGLYLTLVREISANPEKENWIFNNVFTLRFFSSILFLSLAPIVVIFMPYPDIVKWGVVITTLTYFFNSLVQILTSVFQRKLAMGKAMTAEILGRIAHLVALVIIIYLGGNLLAVLLGNIANTFVYFLALFYLAGKFLKIKFSFDFSFWLKILKKTWPIALGIFFNLIYFKADTLILSFLKPAGDVGIYGAPYKFLEILTTLPHLFLGLLLPIMAGAWVKKNIKEFKQIFQICFDLFVIIGMPMIAGGLIVGTPLIAFFAGNEFLSSGPVLKILIVATALIFFGTLFNYVIIAIDKQKKLLKYFIITSILSVIGYLIFIPPYSYYGAAWVTVAGEAFIALMSFTLGYRITKIGLNLKIFYKILPATLVMSGFLYFFKNFHVALIIIIGIIIYFILLIIFKAIRIDFIKQILKRVDKSEMEVNF